MNDYKKIYRRALYKGVRIQLEYSQNGFYSANIDAADMRLKSYDFANFPKDIFINPSWDKHAVEGLIHVGSNDIVMDDTGRLSAEWFSRYQPDFYHDAFYKGHAVRVSNQPGGMKTWSDGSTSAYYTVQVRAPLDNLELKTLDWLPWSHRPYDYEFFGMIPVADAHLIRRTNAEIDKMAFYKGLYSYVFRREAQDFTIKIVVPEPEQYKNMDWLLTNFKQESYDKFFGAIPVSDPDLFIDETGIVREDLLTYTFPVNWRCASYKGHDIIVGARSDTHHFVKYHSGTLLPRGALPDWLPVATQTNHRDYMGKIAIDDCELKL